MDEEVWAIIEEFPNYAISNLGGIRNERNGYVLKPQNNSRGYMQVRISNGGPVKAVKIHQLVARYFLDPPTVISEPNHIDGDKSNNVVTNLEWKTHRDNIIHAYQTGLKKLKRVRIIETGEVYASAADCARAINGYTTAVWACLNNYGRAKKHRGYSFEYVDPE